MKLLYCRECHDFVALSVNERACYCKRTRGAYVSAREVTVTGPCVLLGLDNHQFQEALVCADNGDPIPTFDGFIISPNPK